MGLILTFDLSTPMKRRVYLRQKNIYSFLSEVDSQLDIEEAIKLRVKLIRMIKG